MKEAEARAAEAEWRRWSAVEQRAAKLASGGRRDPAAEDAWLQQAARIHEGDEPQEDPPTAAAAGAAAVAAADGANATDLAGEAGPRSGSAMRWARRLLLLKAASIAWERGGPALQRALSEAGPLHYGVRAGGKWHTHACYADNWFLYAASHKQLHDMVATLTGAMLSLGLFWKLSSMCVLTPMPGNRMWHWQVPQPEDEIFAARPEGYTGVTETPGNRALPVCAVVGTWLVPEVEETMVLGTLLHRTGAAAIAVQHRERLAVKAFYATTALRSRELSLKERFSLYSETVPATLLLGCESWVLTNTLVLRLKQMEGGMLRKMAGVRKFTEPTRWTRQSPAEPLLTIQGDSQIVVDWVEGRARCRNQALLPILREAQETLGQTLGRGARPPQVGQCLVHRVYRENNKTADAMATRAVAERRSLRMGLAQALPWQPAWPWRLSAAFDGGRRGTHAGCGWAIWIQAPDRWCWVNSIGYCNVDIGHKFLQYATNDAVTALAHDGEPQVDVAGIAALAAASGDSSRRRGGARPPRTAAMAPRPRHCRSRAAAAGPERLVLGAALLLCLPRGGGGSRLPLPKPLRRFVNESRAQVAAILGGEDDRLMAVVGPCSVHDPVAVREYAQDGEKLRELAEALREDVFVVMRSYLEKPRTSVGWRGIVSDPDLSGEDDMERGIEVGRRVLLDVNAQVLPAALEFLDPLAAPYFEDLVTYGTLGARTVETGPDPPGARRLAADGGRAQERPRRRRAERGQRRGGRVGAAAPRGAGRLREGPRRGGTREPQRARGAPGRLLGPELRPGESVADAVRRLSKAGLGHRRVVVDCSHANSGKRHEGQLDSCRAVGAQVAGGSGAIAGVMVESFLRAGNQPLNPGVTKVSDLEYGLSVTDACMDFDTTRGLLQELAAARSRRQASG
ncbi:unnamed protein product [Prorocentrum cordatum]|uniref:3-deoxy-7-phosphoheptulonate synthase n=1 Tax=Prorocentrum cordatum TaxID=2364126 RepID=A0ABN9TJL0_9DINO|nr:unnamed protein product [Polarella glacialis]